MSDLQSKIVPERRGPTASSSAICPLADGVAAAFVVVREQKHQADDAGRDYDDSGDVERSPFAFRRHRQPPV